MIPSGGVPASGGAPLEVHSTRASIARVYDAALGGTDNFEIDRQVLAQVREVAPEVNHLAWSNRRFLARAVRFLGEQGGIRQFLDCGSGLPTAENTHQIARRIDPASRVVYVDNDAAVIAHSEALLAATRLSRIVSADIFQPAQVLGHHRFATHLDFCPTDGVVAGGDAAPLQRGRRRRTSCGSTSRLCPRAATWSWRTSSTRRATSSARSPGGWKRCSCTVRCARGCSAPVPRSRRSSPAWRSSHPVLAGPASSSCATSGGPTGQAAPAQPGRAVHRCGGRPQTLTIDRLRGLVRFSCGPKAPAANLRQDYLRALFVAGRAQPEWFALVAATGFRSHTRAGPLVALIWHFTALRSRAGTRPPELCVTSVGRPGEGWQHDVGHGSPVGQDEKAHQTSGSAHLRPPGRRPHVRCCCGGVTR